MIKPSIIATIIATVIATTLVFGPPVQSQIDRNNTKTSRSTSSTATIVDRDSMSLMSSTFMNQTAELSGYANKNALREYAFPEDYFPHWDQRGEIWNIYAVVRDDESHSLGLQLTFMRLAVRSNNKPLPKSDWAYKHLLGGAAALYDASALQDVYALNIARVAQNMAGATKERVWINDWYLLADNGPDCQSEITAHTKNGRFGFDLKIKVHQCPATQQSGSNPGVAHGYLIPQAFVSGVVTHDGYNKVVSGHAWLERAWGNLRAPSGAVLVDRFWLTYNEPDGPMILELIRTRRRDGSGLPTLSGRLFKYDGETIVLDNDDIDLQEHANKWRFVNRFPNEWLIEIPVLNLSATIEPLIPSVSRDRNVSNGWSGFTSFRGTTNGSTFASHGFVETPGG